MKTQLNIGDKVYESERFHREGRSNFGKELRNHNGKTITKIETVDNFTLYTLNDNTQIRDIFVNNRS